MPQIDTIMSKNIKDKFLIEFNLAVKKHLNKNPRSKIDNSLKKQIQILKKNFLDKGNKFVILNNFSTNKEKVIKFSKLLGKTLAQNKSGKKFLIVKPNLKKLKSKSNKKIRENLRYHQTNLGGSIHSDGPQLVSPPKYIIMGCLNQAEKGGFSIIVSMEKIYKFLKKRKPYILKKLEEKYIFERRGFSKKVFYQPIFKKKKNIIKFRYLREYIETGYKIKNKTLDKKKLIALNTLDKLISNKQFQNKYKMSKGDIIILNNDNMAHGRSSFSLKKSSQNRSLIRLWIR